MNSKLGSSSLYSVSNFFSIDVKLRQGGHQCALKYKPRVLPFTASTPTVLKSCFTKESPRASQKVGGTHGKPAHVSKLFMTFFRPSVVTTFPSGPRTIRLGMPWTLYFLLSVSLAPLFEKGRASHGISPKYSLKDSKTPVLPLSASAVETSPVFPCSLLPKSSTKA